MDTDRIERKPQGPARMPLEAELLARLIEVTDELEASVARSLPQKATHLASQLPAVVEARTAIAKATGAKS